MGFRVSLFLLLASLSAAAQTTPAATTPAPASTAPAPIAPSPKEMPLDPNLPTVFIIGDSSARLGMDFGWGDHFAPFFDLTRVNIANRALGGRSSRTFINEGKWDRALKAMKPGDFVLLQMGHNDNVQDIQAVAKDPRLRMTIHSIGEETIDVPVPTPYTAGPYAGQPTETVHTFGYYTRKMIREIRAKGATPILMTITIHDKWTNGKIERENGFLSLITQLAAAEHVDLIDMAKVESDRLQALGEEKTTLLYQKDRIHTTSEGADFVAHDVVVALRAAHSPVAAFLKQ